MSTTSQVTAELPGHTNTGIQEGTVVRYARQFNGAGRTYKYAAMYASGRWFTTSKTSDQRGIYNHEAFLALLQSSEVYGVQMADAFADVQVVAQIQSKPRANSARTAVGQGAL